MRSIEPVVHIEGRSTSHTLNGDVARSQQPQSPISSSSPLPTVRIQQATISTSQQFTIATNTMETGHPITTATTSESAAPSQEKFGLSSKSIAGLAMIPVVVLLIIIAIFTYFWLRKRRIRSSTIRHLGPSPCPPAVPEKDLGSPATSFETAASEGPISHTGWIASSRPRVQTANESAVHYNPWTDQLPKISADITTAGIHASRGAIESENDSPIDRSSPFRLKRGDTRKRSSLDPDVMSAWPAPPQPAAQPAPPQYCRTGKTYMERRSISAEYFAQERDSFDVRGASNYWEDMRLELGPDPGPTVRSH